MYQSVKEEGKRCAEMISHEIIYDFKGDSRNDALIIIEKEPSQFICSV